MLRRLFLGIRTRCKGLGMSSAPSPPPPPAQPTQTSPKPSAKEEAKKLVLFGGPLAKPVRATSIGKLFYERLGRKERADKIIQVDAITGQEMTTQTFFKAAVALAEGLRGAGVGAGDLVVLVTNNSLNTNIAVTGIMLLAAVPMLNSVSVNFGALRTTLQKRKPSFYICQQEVVFSVLRVAQDLHGRVDPRTVVLIEDETANGHSVFPYFPDFIRGKGEELDSFQPGEAQDPAKEVALVMKAVVGDAFTSRAVSLSHLSLCYIFARFDQILGEEEMSRQVVLQAQKIIWMSGFYSCLFSCYYGSKLVVLSSFSEELVYRSMQDYKTTMAFMYPPKIWQLYKFPGASQYDASSMAWWFGVGARLPKDLANAMKNRVGVDIKQGYGLTELGGLVLLNTVTSKPGSIGKLLPECYAKVVSTKTMLNLGPNSAGEMCFKAASIMSGYFGDEKATKQALDKEGFIHSGNYGMYDEEGYFFIIDEIQDVIAYRTHKLSPREIEGTILTLDSVEDVLVGGISHDGDGYRPIAFVVRAKNAKVTAEEIVKHVADNLEEHKHLRGGVVFVPRLPRNKELGAVKRALVNKILANYRFKASAAPASSASPPPPAPDAPTAPPTPTSPAPPAAAAIPEAAPDKTEKT